MNNSVSAKCFLGQNEGIVALLAQNEAHKKIKLEKRGVDCRVSRRGRDLSNTFTPTTYNPDHGNPLFSPNHQTGNSLEEKFYRAFLKFTPKNCYWSPPLIIFSAATDRTHSLSHPTPRYPPS